MDKLILISNDDGYQSQGIATLAEMMGQLGKVVIVAPEAARSGAACSITCTEPVSIREVSKDVYACSGTPVDCVKIALEKILPRTPDLVVSGINYGDNLSVSVHYSGTMGVCLEAATKGIPSIGFSLRTRSRDCNFQPYLDAIMTLSRKVLSEGLPQDVCLNVNFPEVGEQRDSQLNPYCGEALMGICMCRQSRGTWKQEWVEADGANSHRLHPEGTRKAPGRHSEGTDSPLRSFTLTGYFVNLEPEAEDTDCWAVDHGYASVVPTTLDLTQR